MNNATRGTRAKNGLERKRKVSHDVTGYQIIESMGDILCIFHIYAMKIHREAASDTTTVTKYRPHRYLFMSYPPQTCLIWI
jgi:hypothetical protein